MCVCARVLLGSFLLCFAWHESTTTLCLEHWVAWLCFVHAWFHCLLFFIYCKLQQHTKLPCHSIARIQQLCSTTKCCNNRDNGGPLFSSIYFTLAKPFSGMSLWYMNNQEIQTILIISNLDNTVQNWNMNII